jgi:hypothetical protein
VKRVCDKKCNDALCLWEKIAKKWRREIFFFVLGTRMIRFLWMIVEGKFGVRKFGNFVIFVVEFWSLIFGGKLE